MTLRRTKIIATLGPATDDPQILLKMIKAGLNLVRINFSHGQSIDHLKRIEQVRSIANQENTLIGIIADLQGPKIRIARFQNNSIRLIVGATFILDAQLDTQAGNEQAVGIDYKNLPQDVRPKDKLLLDDGRIVLEVKQIKDHKIICQVVTGGELSNNKGINRLGGGLTAGSLTNKDKKDLKTAVQAKVDYIAVSFPHNEHDMLAARKLLIQEKSPAALIAKIESNEAISSLDQIINVSDAVMVARGDLGVEIGDAELPAVQKYIIHRARALNKLVITATQMMESMIHNTIPTRAEVFDVANAVLDGTDAVMLSGETATGNHPDLVIGAMARICLGAEKQPSNRISGHRVECHFDKVDEAIAMATMYTANHFNIKAIIALTESGSTPLLMSRIRSGIPIYGLTKNPVALARMTLFRGVYPVYFPANVREKQELNRLAIKELTQRNIIVNGDYVIITYGDIVGYHGGTNTMEIAKVR